MKISINPRKQSYQIQIRFWLNMFATRKESYQEKGNSSSKKQKYFITVEIVYFSSIYVAVCWGQRCYSGLWLIITRMLEDQILARYSFSPIKFSSPEMASIVPDLSGSTKALAARIAHCLVTTTILRVVHRLVIITILNTSRMRGASQKQTDYHQKFYSSSLCMIFCLQNHLEQIEYER